MPRGVFGLVRLRGFPPSVRGGTPVGGCGLEPEGGCGRDAITAGRFGGNGCCLLWLSEPADTLRCESIFGGGSAELFVTLRGRGYGLLLLLLLLLEEEDDEGDGCCFSEVARDSWPGWRCMAAISGDEGGEEAEDWPFK